MAQLLYTYNPVLEEMRCQDVDLQPEFELQKQNTKEMDIRVCFQRNKHGATVSN